FLKNSHERITLLINSISSILIAVSANNTIEFWNTEAERQFGFTEKEVLGRVIFEIAIPWDWRELAKEIEKCRKGKKSVRVDDLKFTQTSGKEGLLGIRLDNIFSREGSRRSILIQGANITNRKILESQLGQAQKLEAIGSLAAGIAHEINTPSQYVGDNTRFLKDAFGDLKAVMNQYERLLTTAKEGGDLSGLVSDVERIKKEKDLDYLMEDIPNAINQSLEGIERVTSIVQSVKEFSHPEQKEKTYIDINKSLESTITVARNEWKYVAELETIFDKDLPLLFCYPGELNQVLLNMIVNAAHAIEQAQRMDGERKGKIVLCTENQESHIVIKIKDNGSGIPPEIKEKIFDPFFTTKEVGKGTGQGLAISHSVIVEKHGGSIRVISEPGKGSEFIIELPKDVKTDTDDQTGGE
ncbi:MAG: PAS domain S-box protein, partial [Proteobacteria bacterium]|nr:PAS domain S-box protein [Pseudomonadota bacterium]